MSRITATLGGTTRPGVNGIAPKLPQGDLGPRRLIPGASALYRPDDDELETGLDVLLATAKRREAQKRAAIKAVEEYEPVTAGWERRKWTPSEIGILVLTVCAGGTIREASQRTKHSITGCKQKLHDLRDALRNKTPVEYGRLGAKSSPVTKSRLTEAQRSEILALRAKGHGVTEIMHAVGATEGQVRWVIERGGKG